MYGFDEKTWEYIWKNRDFHEVYVPSKGGHATCKQRKEYLESLGFEVIPYEDKGVSVGLYVMTKGGIRTYGERISKDKRSSDSIDKEKSSKRG
jgi:hypothetical protein